MYKWYIYKITNLCNGKTYIGQHRYTDIDDNYMGSGVLLRKAFKKYGRRFFSKTILLSEIANRKDADIAETKYISKERSHGKAEYNITDGGEGFCAKHTENAKRKIHESLIGNTHAKGKNLHNTNALGNILSGETRKQMGLSRMGNTNNGEVYVKCFENGEVHRIREWIKLGYTNVWLVVNKKRNSCKGLHFAYATV